MECGFDKKLLSQIGLLTGLGAVLPVVGTAEASLICTTTQCTETQTFSLTSTPATQQEPVTSSGSSGTVSRSDPQATTVTIDQFDPLLGTLTKVNIGLNSSLTGSLTVGGVGSIATWSAEVTFTMPGLGAFGRNEGPAGLGCGPNSCTATESFGPFALDIPSFSLLPGSFAAYTGTGTVGANLGLNSTVSANNEGTGETVAYGSATYDPPAPEGITVTYTFTPRSTAPEPGTLFLLGMGAMAGLGFARRRSKQNG